MSLASLISEIDAEIARLEQAKQLLCGMPALQKRRGRPLKVTAPMVAPTPKRRTLSAAARAKIAAAQKGPLGTRQEIDR